jgi:hypothetical protein
MCAHSRYCGQIHQLIHELPRFENPGPFLPLDGIYFFFEVGEKAVHDRCPSDRIVRVGNHPHSTHGLLKRLKKHYTSSKKASVFLRIVGGALIRRNNPNASCLQPAPGKGHWERQKGEYCKDCEPYKVFSKDYIRRNMEFTTIAVPDRKIRNNLEQSLISTISLCDQCHPSDNWLGRFAYCELTRRSGLWQIDNLYEEDLLMTSSLMSELEDAVKAARVHFKNVMKDFPDLFDRKE